MTNKSIGVKPRSVYAIAFSLAFLFFLSALTESSADKPNVKLAEDVIVGAERMAQLLPVIGDKRVGLVVNQTSMVGESHLVDTLLSEGVKVKKIFALEHGFRGDADAGALIEDSRDPSTGLEVISLYGQNKKPLEKDLENLDLILFDIQDVGARFYTYISSLHYIMEASAENGVELVVTDRPNPNGYYVDGPVLKSGFESFVGMHPVPVVHGMTIGEYALMIKGESWINASEDLLLRIIPCRNYNHGMTYDLPIAPSPNLPNLRSVLLYPSLCFFEGTHVSVGRGTKLQFQLIGSPHITKGDTSFIPRSMPGATNPPFLGEECRGYSFAQYSWQELTRDKKLNLGPLLEMYHSFPMDTEFFLKNNFFDRLAGTDELRKAIVEGHSEDEIRAGWEEDLTNFKKVRERYLLYPDF